MPLSLSVSLAVLASLIACHAQSNPYAPTIGQCPDSSELLRLGGTVQSSNQTLLARESDYISQRKSVAQSAWNTWLGTRSTGYDTSSLIASAQDVPTLGIAVSGGGYRASLYGAGTINAFDGRNSTSVSAGTGGILQMASYMTGLSGGSWFLGSFVIHDQPSIYDLVTGGNNTEGWILDKNLLLPASVLSFGDNKDYYDVLGDDSDAKEAAGFNTSITDLWGRALSYHLSTGTTRENFFDDDADHGASVRWTDIALTSSFQSHSIPFPIIVCDEKIEGTTNGNPLSVSPVPLNGTVYEFSPFEFGSYDPFLSAFVNITYLGTHLNAGTPDNSTACTQYFDNFGYVIGTSSSLFNAISSSIESGTDGSLIGEAISGLVSYLGGKLSDGDNDVANYPNPFQGINAGEYAHSSLRQLPLVDGGENGENVPLNPLLAQARQVDTIIAVDGSADTDFNWPNGTSLLRTSDRKALLNQSTKFPPVPTDQSVFVNNGYNVRPTFFGCQASSASDYPLVIYLPNSPPPGLDGFQTNTSTLQLDYSIEDASAFLAVASENAYKGFQTDGQTRDSSWPDCLACAVLERRRQAAGVARSSTCETCFSRYCVRPYQDAHRI